MFETPISREAYRRGVRDALSSIHTHLRPPKLKELQEWQRELDDWNEGDPPLPPSTWAGPYLVR
jgi:hypothetical protein